MPGFDEGDKQSIVPPTSPLDPIAKAVADLSQQVVSLWARLEALESRSSATTTTMPPVFPYGLLGYGTTAVSMPDCAAGLSQLRLPASCRSFMRHGQRTIFKRWHRFIPIDWLAAAAAALQQTEKMREIAQESARQVSAAWTPSASAGVGDA